MAIFHLLIPVGLLLILAYLLFIPVTLTVVYSIDRVSSHEVRLQFRPFTVRHRPSKKTKAGRSPAKRRKKFQWIKLLMEDGETIRQVGSACLQFAKGILNPRGHYLEFDLQGGFGSPDITGFAWGMLEAVKLLLGKTVCLVCRPDFTAPYACGIIKVETGFRIYGLLTQVVPFFFRLPKMKIIKAYQNLRKE